MRIAQLLPALNRGGMESFVLNLSHHLARLHTVEVFCTSYPGPLASIARSRGLRVHVIESGVLSNVVPGALAQSLHEFGPDVVHSHSGSWLKAATAARAVGGKRVVHTIHGFHEGRLWLHEPLERLAALGTDRVVAVSEEQYAYAIRRLGVQSDKISIIENGIDVEKFAYARIARDSRAHSGPSPLRIGFLGRLAEVKDPLLLLEAFSLLRSGRSDEILLEYVGDGALRSTLSGRVSALHLDAVVNIIGALDDVVTALSRFDVLCLPSKSEGTSIAALEAMASYCPVVAFAVGGNTKLLGNDCGFLVQERSAVALAAALETVLDSADMRREMADRAFQRVQATYSLEAAAACYENLYTTTG